MMPVLPPLPATATPLQPVSGSLIVPAPPDWLSRLPSGSLIQGIVQERDSAGLVTIATAQGKFSMVLGSPASPGAAISLQIQTSANQTLQAQLLTIERRPAPPGFSGAAVAFPPPAVNILPPPQAGEVVTATIIRTDLPAPAPGTSASTAPAVPQTATPAPAIPGGPTPQTPTPGPTANTAPATNSLATPGLPRQVGDTVTVKLLAITPLASAPVKAGGGAAAPASMSVASNPATITATVLANSANGQPIVIGGSTLMTLATGPLPPGSAIDMIALSPVQRPGASAAPGASFPTYPSLPALAAAAAESGDGVQNALTALLPKPGPALAGEILRFLNAARKGDLNSLIQNEIRAALEKTAKGKNALRSLSQEFVQASRSNSESTSGEWRAFTLPMIWQGAIEPVRLYLHGLADDEAQGRKDASDRGQRFMIEIGLTSLGPLQIDGLAKPTQLDIVLRTPQALPPEVRQGLIRFFDETLAARGLTGMLMFQVAPPVPIARFSPTRPASRGGILA